MSECRQIVITGVTSGLGLALSRYLLAVGHRVFGCGRRDHPMPAADPARFQFRQLDILDAKALEDWAGAIQAERPIDFLVHNAAVIHPKAPMGGIDWAMLEQVIQINVLGTFRVLRAFLPGMTASRRGVIVTLSSGAGRCGIAGVSGYCASKFAVEGLTKALAAELPEPMAAIPLAPGMIDTDMLRTNFGEDAAQYQKPEDWAKRAGPMILGLNREDNGQSLTVPGPE